MMEEEPKSVCVTIFMPVSLWDTLHKYNMTRPHVMMIQELIVSLLQSHPELKEQVREEKEKKE